MSANVETMFSVREKPWHGLGAIIQDYPASVEEGLKLAGLDWEVKMVPLFYGDTREKSKEAEGAVVISRATDNQFFGVTSKKYKILQNREAFSFVDNLMDNGAKFETAGALGNGERVWVLAKMEPYNILGDEIANYLLLSTSHDGTSAVRVNSTNVRVVCQNTLNLALQNAVRSWKTKHMNAAGMQAKLLNASEALNLNNKYIKALSSFAEEVVKIKFSEDKVVDFIYELFPERKDMSKREKENLEYKRNALALTMEADDLQNFKFTGWGLLQGVADFDYHFEGVRKVSSVQEKKMEYALDGSPLLDRAVNVLEKMVA